METLEAMAPGPWSKAMEGRWSGGRAEQAERAERAGMHWGFLKSFDWVQRHRAAMGPGATK